MNTLFYKYIHQSIKTLSFKRKGSLGYIKNHNKDIILPEKKSGLLGFIFFGKPKILKFISPERLTHSSLGKLDSPAKYLYYYDYYLERTRVLFQISLFNIVRKTQHWENSEILFDSNFDTYILEFLVREPKPLSEDFSDIIDKPEMSFEEYEKRYYYRSVHRVQYSYFVTDQEAQKKIQEWTPKIRRN